MIPQIEITNASYNYKSEDEETIGVKNISLSVNKGEFLVLLGHNGSGKSTLAKLLNGFITPDEGKVIIDGMDTADEKLIFEIRKKVGMVFQNPDNQMVASIIEDDIAFGPENLGVEREEIKRRVEWALEKVGMAQYRTHTPFKLSGGQKQRIAIAAILAMLPEVLILDESTAMLDPQGRKEVLSVVKDLNRSGMTVILITHYMDEAIDCDRVVVMGESEILAEGTPKEIFADYNTIKKAKLELPPASRLAALLRENGIDINPCLTNEEIAEEICRLM